MAAIRNRGTVTGPKLFNAKEDAQRLIRAIQVVGADEVIEILPRRTIEQRQRIKEAFKQLVGKDLAAELRWMLTGDFEKVVLGLLMLPPVYDALELKKAMQGLGTDNTALIDILASRTNEEIRAINATYKKEYGKNLEDAICKDTSGMFQRVLVSLLMAYRDESDKVDDVLAVRDAKNIYDASHNRWGTNEVSTLLCVLCVRNRKHLLRVFAEYQKLSGRDIEDTIKRDMSGHVEDAFLAIVKCVRNKPAFFAELLYKSMKGLGTNDSVLIRIMVARSEIDMLDIKAEFLKMYGKTLYSFIKGDTSGHYGKILLALCGPAEQ